MWPPERFIPLPPIIAFFVRFSFRKVFYGLFALLISFCILFSFPLYLDPNEETWNRIIQKKILVAGVLKYPYGDYELINHIPTGYEYEILKIFSEQQGLLLEVKVFSSYAQLAQALQAKKLDIAFGSLPNSSLFDVSASLGVQSIYVVGNQKTHSNSSLAYISPKLIDYFNPATPFDIYKDSSKTADILEAIETAKSDSPSLTILHRDFIRQQLIYPELAILEGEEKIQTNLHFLFPKKVSDLLITHINNFIKQSTEHIKKIEASYFSHLQANNQHIFINFKKLMNKRLPKFIDFFKHAEQAQAIDWRLLAAVGFQESKWNPRATSPTGVRGLMMLTNATAAEVAVHNRLDAEASIMGGALYLKKMLEKIPRRISYPDKLFFALASYNMGYLHLEDVRAYAQSQGKNPDSWSEVFPYLRLLENPQYTSRFKYGYARGREAITYVKNIRRYYEILKHYFPAK